MYKTSDLSVECTNCTDFAKTVSEPVLDHTEFEFKMGILVVAATLVLLSVLAPSTSQEANTTLPLTYRARAACRRR